MNPSKANQPIAALPAATLAHRGRALLFILSMLTALTTLTTNRVAASDNLNLQPAPTLTPIDVVTFQLNALRQASDEGFSATYRFASPANRRMTGPLARFSRLFDSPQYQPMLNNRGTEVKLVSNDGFNAELLAGVVDTSGELHWYRFRLSRQSTPPCENCWMTDAVFSVPYPGDSA